MSSIETVNACVDAVINRLDDNRAKLGNPQHIYEKLEEPAILAEDHVLPVIHVLPLAERDDTMSLTLGDDESLHHDFGITLIGVYDTTSIKDDLRLIREYGYTCADLFKGDGAAVGPGHIYKITMGVRAMTIVDHVLQEFVITLQVKAYN